MLRYSLLAFAARYRRHRTDVSTRLHKGRSVANQLYDNRCRALVLGAREGGAMIGIFDYKSFFVSPERNRKGITMLMFTIAMNHSSKRQYQAPTNSV